MTRLPAAGHAGRSKGGIGHDIPPIQVGTTVVAKRATGVCDMGEPGVCYEEYDIGGRPGWSFIFRSGRYDGFSPDEVEKFLHVTGFCPAVAGYQFRNINRLCRDYEAGYFNAAFHRHPALEPRGPH